jgi:hypothetical protein
MTRSGGRPRHNLSEYVIVLKKNNPEDKDRQCVCKACNEVLKEKATPIINRKERVKKHLLNCVHFWNKYGEEGEEMLRDCISDEEKDELPTNKRINLNG